MSQLDINANQANLPPRNSGTDPAQAIQSAATAAAAGSINLWSGYTGPDGITGPPAGKVWVEVEALTQTAYIRFTRTATTATTTANGAVCGIGVPRCFYVDPSKDLFIDVIAGGVGTLKWRVTSQIGERSRH